MGTWDVVPVPMGPYGFNRVGTFGVACAAYHFARLAGLVGRGALRMAQQATLFQMLFADDLSNHGWRGEQVSRHMGCAPLLAHGGYSLQVVQVPRRGLLGLCGVLLLIISVSRLGSPSGELNGSWISSWMSRAVEA